MYQDASGGGYNGGGGYRGGGQQPPRQMFSGNWACGMCGAPITELPFQPDPARLNTLKCRDCHKKSLAERGIGGGGGGGGFRGNTGGYRRF